MPTTGIVYDPIYLKHFTGPFHPEGAARCEAIMRKLKTENFLSKCELLPPRKATLDELLLCHTQDYIESVEREVKECSWLSTLSTGDVQISPLSFEVALWAVGGVLKGIDALMQGKLNAVFANVRPPGHHACTNMGMGFCLFNNAAIGARYVQKKYGIEKVLIVDWDVHHGNGTEEIFYEDPSVFYFSTHQYPLYPGTGEAEERGLFNTILNVPIEADGHARERVIEAFAGPLMQAMESFQPNFVIISAGFDAHEKDPIGGLNLKDEDYKTLTLIMKDVAQKYAGNKILSVLEGGYDLEGLAGGVYQHLLFLDTDEHR